jgi:3-O-methylgallate 3,4-dioxygenase
MARLVLGIGISHTPMLNGSLEDWSRFIELDRRRAHLDKEGNGVTYDDLMAMADGPTAAQAAPEKLAARHAAAMSNLDRVRDAIRDAGLDSLIIVGDDQNELHGPGNMPCFLIYHGETIRNVPAVFNADRPEWSQRLSARYFESATPRDYPVDAGLAHHLIESLVEREFDIATADSLEPGRGEGHAFGFVHNRLLQGDALPVVPVFMNTYYPPNQATPRRCYRLGQAISEAVEDYGHDLRVGILASGGLSHFTVDEELDGAVMRALREKDAEALCTLPRNKLNSGSSEIRNWICAAGALQSLPLRWSDYKPGYRTPAGTGTGLGFAIWSK